MNKYILFSILILMSIPSFSQSTFKGMIMDKNNPTNNLGVPGANVYWLNTAVGGTTNEKGWFEIPYKSTYKKLVVSFIGYKTDTLDIKNIKPIHHFITEQNTLNEITVSAKKTSTTKSYLQTQNVFTVNSDELLKAACCNLAESFETTPSIDLNFSDALTGTRQIQMLGLKSPYLVIAQENIPLVRGASQIYGLTFTPGTWVESIQITKGAASVVNGFESISGQINAELVKPATDNKFFLNTYASLNGRLELNTHFNRKINNKWQTGLYLHGNYRGKKFDRNDDGFLDTPLAKQINVMNRWQYTDNEKGWISFLTFRYMNDEKQTGQTNFNPQLDRGTTNAWGSEIKTERVDIATKIGYVFPELPFQSIGLQLAYNSHDQDSYFGLRNYDIKQQSIFSNLIFNSIIGDTRNKFKTGISFTHDSYDEIITNINYGRSENTFGTFFEYAYDNGENFSLTAGIRADNHNLIGAFITPRLHVRYVPWKKGVLRASVGKGKRTANIFAENQQLFASSRVINIIPSTNGATYGLNAETAWNYGVSFLQGFRLFKQKGDVTLDFYQTRFNNQVVVDWENPQEITFYNLNGKSIANSLQLEVNYTPFNHVNLRMAYKYFDVNTDYLSGNLSKPLQPKHRFFTNLSIETLKKENGAQWKFDITTHLIGKQRLPNTNGLQSNNSDAYNLINLQLTKVFSNKLETYFGGENITNYKQQNPILGNNDPFGANFDSTLVYAPVFGSTFYLGLRFKIK